MRKYMITTIILIGFAFSLVAWYCGVKEKVRSHYADPYPGVLTPSFYKLPVGAVRPEGWLKRELEAWANGITGHLHEYQSETFWDTWDKRPLKKDRPRDVTKLYDDSWWPFEQQGYWADGITQLAYILDDDRLKGIAEEFMNKVLAGQNPDGYMGVFTDAPYGNSGDIYVLSELTLGLMSYYSATNDPRIIPAMQKAFRHIYENCLPFSGKGQELPPGWTWPSESHATLVAVDKGMHIAWLGTGWPYSCHIIDAVLWVYSQTGDQQVKALADEIYKAMQEVPSDFTVQHLLTNGATVRDNHAVDVAETIRIPAMYAIYSGDIDDLNATIKALESVDRHHIHAHGGAAADEHLRDRSPVGGTEYCTNTVFNYTRQAMFAITGEVKYADGIEKTIFNIGAGAAKPDRKAMQYFTAANQVAATTKLSNRAYLPDADPNTLCCVGEATRLHPNYVATAMWLAAPDYGLAAVCYGPSTVSAKAGKEGSLVTIAEETNYPFEEKIRFVIKSSESMEFPFYLRIPGWCEDASIEINGQSYLDKVGPDRMVRIDRRWVPGDQVELNLPMRIRFSRWDKASVAVERGPLTYALKIKENWKKIAERFPGFPDWDVLPGSDWNYALSLDVNYAREHSPEYYFKINYPEVPEGSYPWEYSPIELVCKGRKVDGWKLLKGDRTPYLPQSPVVTDNPLEEVTLIPVGFTHLRITYFPVTEPEW